MNLAPRLFALLALSTAASAQTHLTFRQGLDVGGSPYLDVEDTFLDEANPDTVLADAPSLWSDGSARAHILVRFANLVGPDRIPAGSVLAHANFTIHSVDGAGGSGQDHSLRTILEPWDVDSVTYANSFGGDGVASESGPVVSTIASPGSDETFVVSVHSIVQGWVDGANHGLSITPNGGPFWQDGFGIWSSEEPVAASRPSLDAWLLPQGLASFADSVVSFEPGDGTNGNDDPLKALGPANEGDSVSLGDGGTIVLEFTDNVLTGSSTSDPDLWIYEIGLGGFGGTGSADESVFVSVSSDGSTWHEVGTAKGGSDAIDLDASGFGPGDAFSFVRLVDDGIDGSCSCSTPGADITAIAGIETSAFSTLTESGTPVATLFDAPHLGGAVFEDTGSYELSLVGGNGQPEAPLVLYYSPLLFPAPVPALGVDFLVPPTFDPIPAVNEGHGAFYFAAPIPASIVGFDLHFQAFFIEDLVGPALSSSNAATLSW